MAETRVLSAALTVATEAQKGVTQFAVDGASEAGKAVQSTDARLSNARTPSGAAGGVLTGEYPNPSIANTSITEAMLAFDPATQAELTTHAAVAADQTTLGHVTYEQIQDMLSTALVGGTGISVTYDDIANTITLASTSGSPLTLEDVDDRVAALVIGGDNITATYDDTANTLTLAVTGTLAPARLGSGSATANTLLHGDSTWGAVANADLSAALQAQLASFVDGTGTANRAVFWQDTNTLQAIANSIYWDSVNSRVGIGTEAPMKALHVVGESQFDAQINAIPVTGAGVAPIRSMLALTTATDPATSGPTAVLMQARATYSASTSQLTTGGLMDAGITPASGTTVSGTSGLRGNAAIARNLGLGRIDNAFALWTRVQNSSGGLITRGVAVQAGAPLGTCGGTIDTAIGVLIEAQKVTGVTTAYAVSQDGVNDLNLWKGATTHDAKVTFNAGTVGLKRSIGGWVAELPAIGDHYGYVTIPVDENLTVLGIGGYAITPPTGSAATFDIEYKRGAGAWTTLFSVLPTFAAGSNTPTAGTLAVTQLNDGDYLRLNWDAVNSIGGVTVTLKASTR